MTTLEIIKMLVEQAIIEDNGYCGGCEYETLQPDKYPCSKCKRIHLDYYKNTDEKEINKID